MKIVVSANGATLDAPTSQVFGRCPTFIFVDTETMDWEALDNPAIAASGGAGIQSAQFVVERGVQAVITGNLGPNAADVFQAAGLPAFLNTKQTVRAAVEAFKAGDLTEIQGASVKAHAGMPLRKATPHKDTADQAPAGRDVEIAQLRELAADLRQQMADVFARIDKLEKEN